MKVVFRFRGGTYTIEDGKITGPDKTVVSLLKISIKYFRNSPSMPNWYIDFVEKTLGKGVKILSSATPKQEPNLIH